MGKSNEYRAKAAHCQRMAAAASHADVKQQWSSLAQSWLGLLRPWPRPETEASNAGGMGEVDRAKESP
jgi:hypothetical protein